MAIPVGTPTIVAGADTKESWPSAEVDAAGRPYLAAEKWQRMGETENQTPGGFSRMFTWLYGNLPAEDRLRVVWLAGTLFFIIGG